ncbi:MAG: hypothetical protein LBV17_01560 [Treponema sp.]|jgi:hypothetical protein|nr:hypothetical protein [Treponema sp.]
MTEVEKGTGMMDAECVYWDDYVTKNPVNLGPDLAKLGIKSDLAHDYFPLNELEHDLMEYLRKRSTAFHKNQIQIINDLVREKLAIAYKVFKI